MRDFLLAVAPAKALPRKVSLRTEMPPVYDQGQLGSCTANSIGAILEFNELQAGRAGRRDAVAPLHLLQRARHGGHRQPGLRRGDPGRDQVGRAARRAARDRLAVRDHEVREEAAGDDLQGGAQAPGDPVRARRRRTQIALQNVLAAGFPISFGFTVYESFESDVGANGIVPMPQPDESALGGHAVVASATRRSGASSTSSAATPGARAGPTTATSGCRPATSRAARSRATSG